MIRQAQAADTPAIAALWNPVIRDTTITFTSAMKTADGLAQDIALKAAQDLPFLLAETAGGALQGFATYGPFRNGPGYAHTMEHTIILAPEARGQGVGAGLMAQLQAHAAGQGVHSLWAGVSAENPGGVAFHRAIGFAEIARLPEVGRKFGRWLDLILMQKIL